MALETVVFQQDPLGSINGRNKDFLHALIESGNKAWNYGYDFAENDMNINFHAYKVQATDDNDNIIVGQHQQQAFNVTDLDSLINITPPPSSLMAQSVVINDHHQHQQHHHNAANFSSGHHETPAPAPFTGRRKRRRTRIIKNKEEVENQRMTHIAVERNRRKQMNDYLAVLRSMMPSSYVQRGDQASIIGGAINFVKEMEQLLQFLEAQKQTKRQSSEYSQNDNNNNNYTNNLSSLFSKFFIFPQYSTYSAHHQNDNKPATDTSKTTSSSAAEKRSSAVADVEVTMVENHANIKVLLKRHQKQLLKMVMGLQFMKLLVLHLNVTTVGSMVLYSFSVKAEDDSQLTSVTEIAASVYEMVGKIQKEEADLANHY